ncbi:zinc finger protein 593 isoform X2 [Vitis riparia]|uniref:zinc finger protein 593 isoform X2 n=1 Tax=Vitis riparia TaxID=96939 RepID=UPI00155A80EE|nr:zinc finger protein 593 isoform X2 [Vitis riparia]
MGGKCPSRKVKKRRYSHKTARRDKFLLKGDDAVYDELNKPEGEKKPLPVDEDLPGMGQYYCLHCDRYFANVAVRDEHFKTKRHKKRSLTPRNFHKFKDSDQSAEWLDYTDT